MLDDHNPNMTRNPNLITIHDVARNPNPTKIQDAIRNPYPTWIENPFTYNASPLTWARDKKMKEALHMLIPTIWA